MLGIKAKLAKNTEEDKKLLIETCNVLAKFVVWEEYLKQTPPLTSPSEAKLNKDYKSAFDTIIVTAKHDPDQFRDIVYRFSDLSERGKLPDHAELEKDARDMRTKLDVLRASGEVRADAAKWMTSRITHKASKHSAKSLGVEMSQHYGSGDTKTKKTGLFSGLFSKKDVFDPNTKSTTEGNRAERTIDRTQFKEDRFYRKVLEDDMKRIKKRGGLSDEEIALVNEHNRLKRAQNGKDKEHLSESDKILKSMTVGEKALYDIAKIPFSIAKGIFKFATKAKKPKPLIEESVEAVEHAKEEVEPVVDIELEKERAAKRIEIAEKPTQPRDSKGRFTKIEKPEEDDAKAESSIEKAGEFEEKQLDAAARQIEISNKQLEILGKIDEDIKAKNESAGGIPQVQIPPKPAPIPTTPKPPIEAATPRSLASRFLPFARAATGVGMMLYSPEVGAGEDAEMRAMEAKESNVLEDKKLAKKQNLPYEVVEGTTERKNKAEKEYFDAIDSGDSEKAKATADVIGYTPVKKNLATNLQDKKDKADIAKEAKSNANMAGAVSNVVNNSPNNSVVAPQQVSKGRDTPRNPDNSLSSYLNSRVLKFT